MKNRIIILDDCKFDWTPEQIDQAKLLFKNGVPPSGVAEIMKENQFDIGLLFLHLKKAGDL